MPYGKKKPMMMKMGSKEKNTPMNFSEKAMKYMKDMPAMYGKPKMMKGDPPKKKYTATDSTNFMGMWNRQMKDVKKIKNYLNKTKKTKPLNEADKGRTVNMHTGTVNIPTAARDRVYRRLDSLNASPFAETFARRNFPKMYGKKK